MREWYRLGWVVAWLGATSAMGAMVEYSVLVNQGGSPYASGSTGTFELPQFDPEMGNLQSVAMTLTGYFQGGSLAVDNEWTAAGKLQMELGGMLVVLSPDLQEIGLTGQWSTPLTTVAADDDGAADFSGADSVRLIGTWVSDMRENLAMDMQPFLGTGTIQYSFLGEGYASVLPLSPLDVDGRLPQEVTLPGFSLAAHLVYEYGGYVSGDENGGGAVPEPGTLGMGITLAGLSLAGWFRRRSRGGRTRGRP